MYYEIYIDSLFLLNFTMNLYLLLLVNKKMNRTATRVRLFAGAVMGGLGFCLMFLIPFPNALVKIIIMALLVNSGILVFVFRPGSVSAFWKLLETMLLYSFLMGGGFLLLKNHVRLFREHMMTTAGILAFGALFFLLFSWFTGRHKNAGNELCRVELSGPDGRRVMIRAIVDTGNCLKEPISGKPVSVLEKTVFENLFKEERPEGFRAIPYRSVGCENGIMKGYEVPEITVMQGGIKKVCRNAYVGISEGAISASGSYQMLVHPELMEQ